MELAPILKAGGERRKEGREKERRTERKEREGKLEM